MLKTFIPTIFTLDTLSNISILLNYLSHLAYHYSNCPGIINNSRVRTRITTYVKSLQDYNTKRTCTRIYIQILLFAWLKKTITTMCLINLLIVGNILLMIQMICVEIEYNQITTHYEQALNGVHRRLYFRHILYWYHMYVLRTST